MAISSPKNKQLTDARSAKQDEFYTQLPDIEREMAHYREHFKGKVVYCNCDDPRVSNFFVYFSYNFEKLGLKKLITTCYRSQTPNLFSQNASDEAVWLEYTGDQDGSRVPDPAEIGIKPLVGDGDFRSPESIELLKQADIVATNPPFSLFREYVAQLIAYEKQFIIIGNKNAITYKETFKLIREGRLWVGARPMGQDILFDVPDHLAQTLASERKEGSAWRRVNGKVVARAAAIWFTNLDLSKRHEDLILYRAYDAAQYPRFDNYDAINVNKVSDIPFDYPGVMGVPITFLDKFNPDQFEVVDANDIRLNGTAEKPHGLIKDKESAINGKPTYVRIAIRNKRV